MLAITRRVGEQIVLSMDGKILGTITVHEVTHSHQVRLAFDMPLDVNIARREVFDAEVARGKCEALKGEVEG